MVRAICGIVLCLCMASPALAFTPERCAPDRLVTMFSEERVKSCEDYVAEAGRSAQDKARALYFLGFAYTQQQRKDEQFPARMNRAIDAWLAAIEADGLYEEPYLAAARYMILGGSAAAGLERLEQAQRLAPFDWRVYSGKARALVALDRRADALRAAEMAVSLAPGSKVAIQSYGQTLFDLSHDAEAAQAFIAAKRPIAADHPEEMGLMQEANPLELAALALYRIGRPAEAAARMREMLAGIDPRQQVYMDLVTLAGYEEAAKDFASAAASLERALTLPGAAPVEELKIRLALDKVRAGQGQDSDDDISARLEHAEKRQILIVQVFLKNSGFETVDINGTFDDATRGALRHCLEDSKCAAGLGRQI